MHRSTFSGLESSPRNKKLVLFSRLAMDRIHLIILCLPMLLFCTDLSNLFSPPPPKPHHHHQQNPQSPQSFIAGTIDFATQLNRKASDVWSAGYPHTITIKFCASCSYRGTAITMKNMLETAFPGTNVVLSNYPAPIHKRLLAKLVPVVQFGVMGIMFGGEHIFPMLGITTPPNWYYSMRSNRFGSIASTWLLGNALQSFLQSSGAFEVYFKDKTVFSKKKEGRFPGEFELRDLVTKTIV